MARQTIHYTKRGRVINMSALASRYATKPALAVGTSGNFNARGDLIDKGGKIVIKTQEQIITEFQRIKDLQNSNSIETIDIKDPSLEIENSKFEPVMINEEETSDEKQATTQPKRRKIIEAD